MKILLLGYGVEGRSAEKYCKTHFKSPKIEILKDFDPSTLKQRDYSSYDIIFRSPSVPPLGLKTETSVTKYFFNHCPCEIIGVTATKGKGTTCSLIKSLLDAEGQDAYLVGNIGTPALDILDNLTENSVVVYELSSFQLWDLEKSPRISVIGTIEPDHLNVHKDFADYTRAKSNICRHQKQSDFCIYFSPNPETKKIADTSPAEKIAYPFQVPNEILDSLALPGAHNRENAVAALAAVASYKNISPDEYCAKFTEVIKTTFSTFKGLPHRLEFVRELNGVKYYDDNFSTNPASTRVAVDAFPDQRVILILGGRDKTGGADYDEIIEICARPNISEVVFIGENGRDLARLFYEKVSTDPISFYEETLEDALTRARGLAESCYQHDDFVILMSPAAASFDMFKNVYDRGDQFQRIVKSLK